MWEMRKALPDGRRSIRIIFLLVASLLATISLALATLTAPAAAAPTTDATWNENSIVYKDKTYRGPNVLDNDTAGYDLPKDTIYYINAESPVIFGSKEVKVIYFAANSKPNEATKAQFVSYKSSNTTGALSNKSNPIEITLDSSTAPVPSSPNESDAANSESSCKIRGIGWFICPITTFLAEGMDWIFTVLQGFVAVEPLSTNTDSTMHRAWDVMRSFANVAFVIAFLMIIFSQLTSTGISNYGIKKLLPRIIIAAILVNVSYWICVVAVDLSNILGSSLQGIFIGLRNMIGIDSGESPSWQDITVLILSGGALGAAAVGTFITSSFTAASVAGLPLLLVPVLVGAALTLLVVVFILAVRQALITILVIIAPLAFVAYLLPNTEKWFEKWRSLFMTMLIFFPAFSVVFGGSQFAGAMIIDAAKGNIVMVLLGMAVQIAPLAITPLLLKLSGTLLSRIGGLVNDPTRGIKDRAKNWSKDRSENHKAVQMARTRRMASQGTLKRRHAIRQSALRSDNMRRSREDTKGISETDADTQYNKTDAGKLTDTLRRNVEREKQIVQQTLDKEWNVKAKVDLKSLDKELELRVTADEAAKSKEELESVYAEAKAGARGHYEQISGHNLPLYGPQQSAEAISRVDLLNRAQDTASHLALEGMRKSEADRKQRSSVSDMLYKNREMYGGKNVLDYAAGIGSSEMLQATTIATVRKEYGEHVSAQDQLMQHLKLDATEYQKAASGLHGDIVIDDERGKHTFKVDNEYVREAAIAHQGVAGSFGEKLELLEQSWGDKDAAGNIIAKGTTYDFRDSIQDMVKKGMLGAAPFANDKSLNAVLKGEYKGRPSTVYHSIRQIYEGRVKSEAISTANNVAMEIMYDVASDPAAIQSYYDSLNPATRPTFANFKTTFDQNYLEMQKQASDVLSTPLLRKNVNKELLDVLNDNAVPR